MQMRLTAILAVLALSAYGGRAEQYVQEGECETEEGVCLYSYSAKQAHFEEKIEEEIQVDSTVRLWCDSYGHFGELRAKRFCMSVHDSFLSGNVYEENAAVMKESDSNAKPQQTADGFLEGWFCFVQTEEGKVVEVFHSKEADDDAINFKKGIASAFQANFKETEEDVEEDAESLHKAHYSYEKESDGTVKMHRSISSDDVISYSAAIPKDEMSMSKEEDVEVKSGKIVRSSGKTAVQLLPRGDQEDIVREGLEAGRHPMRRKRQTEESDDTYDGSFSANEFRAHGSYSLTMSKCYTVRGSGARRRREVAQFMMGDEFTTSSLQAKYNKTKSDIYKMQKLREAMPSIAAVLQALHTYTATKTGDKLASRLGQLLELESENGPLPGYTPALDDTLNHLQRILTSPYPDDVAMRVRIYHLLSVEGSLKSQKALLAAFKQTENPNEKNTLIVYLALAKKPAPEFIAEVEELIDTESDTDPLLLAYGALTSKVAPELHQHMVSFLTQRLTVAQSDDEFSIVHLIHSLGNTDSSHTTETLLPYLKHANMNVQLASVNALRWNINDPQVQRAFFERLTSQDLTEEEVEAIAKTLIEGYEQSKMSGKRLREEDIKINEEVVDALATAALQFDSPSLHKIVTQCVLIFNQDMLDNFVNDVNGMYTWTDSKRLLTNGRKRRGTDWDQSSSVYNLVEDYSTRRSDVNTYPHHRAYIWGKTLGVTDLNIQIAAGGFTGVSSDGSKYKLFAKGVVRGNAFGRSLTAVNAEILREKDSSWVRWKIYAKVVGYTLINEGGVDSPGCRSYAYPLNSTTINLFSFSYSVFISVGYLDFTVGVDAELDIYFKTEFCEGTSVFEISAGLVPNAKLTATAEASATILGVARAGVTIAATFTYELNPRMATYFCVVGGSLRVQNCVEVFHGWPDNYVTIYAWYQLRSINYCCGSVWGYEVCVPCGISWGDRHKWHSLSATWDIGSKSNVCIARVCDNSITC